MRARVCWRAASPRGRSGAPQTPLRRVNGARKNSREPTSSAASRLRDRAPCQPVARRCVLTGAGSMIAAEGVAGWLKWRSSD